MMYICVLPSGNASEFPGIESEARRRRVDLLFCTVWTGGRVYRVDEDDVAKLPKEKRTRYLPTITGDGYPLSRFDEQQLASMLALLKVRRALWQSPGMRISEYVVGADRINPDESRAHLYARDQNGEYWPMCDYGWNRSDGASLSILRGHSSRRGLCAVCQERADKKLPPILIARAHKTRWL